MKILTLEIRDRMTMIPAIAIYYGQDETDSHSAKRLMRHAGFGEDGYVYLMQAAGGAAHYGPYQWGSDTRTMPAAHQYIIDNFHDLDDGDVVDVEFILGESDIKKRPEHLERMEF